MKPIIFCTDMVRAIQDGRKTMTRWVIKVPPFPYSEVEDGGLMLCDKDGDWHDAVKCSPIQPGNILWVRETWMPETEQGIHTGGYIYKATDKPEPDGESPLRWRPSIHMPRAAARLFLRVTDVRVERVQDITDSDAKAEGCFPGMQLAGPNSSPAHTARQGFMWLWQRLNDKRGYGWIANPWVWVIEFERCEEPQEDTCTR